ncbi:MAG: LysM domain-containing protein [Sporolactobacillus sp.]
MKKKSVFTIIALIACWTTYSDLSSGSLPASSAEEPEIQTASAERAAIAYKAIKVSPGDTLLSISERINKDEPAIDKLVRDFSTLNPSVDPNHLEIGKTYAFPCYTSQK